MGALLDNKTVELVPHTGVRVFGREVVFSGGIRAQDPTQVVEAMGHGPVRVEAMGETSKTEDELDEFLCSIAASWTAESYDLWTKNCNNFSDEIAHFLVGVGIPRHEAQGLRHHFGPYSTCRSAPHPPLTRCGPCFTW